MIHPTIAFIFGPPGMGEMVILAVVGVLVFGKRLPDVGKSMGKGILEFKKALSGVKNEIDDAGKPTPPETGPQNAPPAPKTEHPDQP
jgi:sec-independent protein translocase protein TatA